ncbi:hypothetical protein DBV39_15725 [Orrella marina]|uniref:Uncharacterized protein n=1 Tax=Orrella marina TaxID=2163011 RepID=A0A2R4XMB9_9BURK|nr:hypothetical protein DBV39_15725 [Orrella marina]
MIRRTTARPVVLDLVSGFRFRLPRADTNREALTRTCSMPSLDGSGGSWFHGSSLWRLALLML